MFYIFVEKLWTDEIEFYYRDEVKQDAVLAARWLRNEDVSEFTGTLLWEEAVEAKSKILTRAL